MIRFEERFANPQGFFCNSRRKQLTFAGVISLGVILIFFFFLISFFEYHAFAEAMHFRA
jgi:hypothetical protein